MSELDIRQCAAPPIGCGRLLTSGNFATEVSKRCRECENKTTATEMRKAERKAEERKQMLKSFVASMVGREREDQIDVPHISELAAEMLKKFGGLSPFAQSWFSEIQAARAMKPGSKTVLDQYAAIGKLIKYSTENRHSAPDAYSMSDEEIAEELISTLANRLHELTPGERDAILVDINSRMTQREKIAQDALNDT